MSGAQGPEDRPLAPRVTHWAEGRLLAALERLTLPLDRRRIRRTRSLDHVPGHRHRTGGKASYGEWCWLIGLLEGEFYRELREVDAPHIIDLGCGSGLVAAAASSVVRRGGSYLGLDVQAEAIEFCRRNYPPNYRFEVIAQKNAHYRPSGDTNVEWPAASGTADLVTAVSVWTHLTEVDTRHALAETSRVLRAGGRLIFTAFVKDDGNDGVQRQGEKSAFHRTRPSAWNFETPVSDGWWTTKWADPPERAVAIDRHTLTSALSEAGLRLDSIRSGTWSERPGLYFQDIVTATRI